MNDLQQKDKEYIANTYSRFPITIVKGKGPKVWDDTGKEYIDFSTGIAVNTFGAADDKWLAAVTAQLNSLPHMSNLFYTEPDVKLAEMLCRRTGMSKVFFSNSGAEANECAIKVARKYAADKYGPKRNLIVTLKDSFHGRTITTLSATGQEVFHKDFNPLTPGFAYAEPNNLTAMRNMTKRVKCAAVIMEMVQGESGVNALNKSYVQRVAKYCEKHDVLLICDEVQCGNGRSGELYAYMNYGIKPDIVTTAKGLAGGLPLGATILGEKVKDVLTPGTHGSTFGGNPVCCAGAISILERIDDALLAGVKNRSGIITSRLMKSPGVVEVTGMGLMLGVKTVKPVDEVVAKCRENGVLVIKAKDKIRLLPPLNIPLLLLDEALDIIIDACN